MEYLSLFSLNTGEYGPEITLYLDYLSEFSSNTGKYGAEITPYLDTFQAVHISLYSVRIQENMDQK